MLYLFYIHSDVLSLDLYGDYRTLTGVDWCRRRAAPMTGSARNRLWYLPTSALCYNTAAFSGKYIEKTRQRCSATRLLPTFGSLFQP